MKKLLKKINVFGLALILTGGIAIATQSAFTSSPKSIAKQAYGRLSNGTWVLIGSTSPGSGQGQYTCETSNKPCRAYFNSQPAPNQTPASGDVIQNNGDFTIH